MDASDVMNDQNPGHRRAPNPLTEAFPILVFDRNRHIRELVKREFQKEGYQVRVARTFHELIALLQSGSCFSLMILDLELQDIHDNLAVVRERLKARPSMNVVVHMFNELPEMLAGLNNVCFVEKNARSIEVIKARAKELWPQTNREGGSSHGRQPDELPTDQG